MPLYTLAATYEYKLESQHQGSQCSHSIILMLYLLLIIYSYIQIIPEGAQVNNIKES